MQQLFNFNGQPSITLDWPSLPRGATTLTANSAGQLMIDTGVYPLQQLLARGLTLAVSATITGSRPTANLYPGMPAFDTTLGIPIWRDAANTGWVNASGTVV